jgi:hypothetical protein
MIPDLDNVLRMTVAPQDRKKVKRHYLAWRAARGIPQRCDQQGCQFYRSSLLWNGQVLPLILDHISGNSADNSPDNLRLLCPNCDSQNSHTRGGANARRVNIIPNGNGAYEIRNRDGTQDAKVNGAHLTANITLHAGTIATTVNSPTPDLDNEPTR